MVFGGKICCMLLYCLRRNGNDELAKDALSRNEITETCQYPRVRI